MKLRVGDLVEVRSKEEILATLDESGRLEELPFMPQMLQYCGQRLPVFASAHKTCDTVHQTGGRRLTDSVHLNLRCDGQAYGGCQAECLIFWKTAWLKPVDEAQRPAFVEIETRGDCTEEAVWRGTQAPESSDEEVRYCCQATQLPRYTTLLSRWDFSQYLEDYRSGNTSLGRILCGAIYAAYYKIMYLGIGLGRPMRWFYDWFQGLVGGYPYPRRRGVIPKGSPTPVETLNLQPGELVRVKSFAEILATLDTSNKNRGLYFDAEEVPFCGKVFRVRSRLSKFIDERSGRLIQPKMEAIILEDVWCQARYSDCRMFCPRAIYSWWREIWLERVEDPATPQAVAGPEGS